MTNLSQFQRSKVLPWLALLIVWFVWGSTYLGIRVAVETIPPLLMAGTRYLVAGVLMLAVAGPRHATGAKRPTWRQVRSTVIVGALMLVGGNGLLSVGERSVNSGLAALVVATVPVWMVLINAVVTKTRVSRAVLGALALGIVGIAVLVGWPDGKISVGGVVIILIASVLWAAGTVYARGASMPANLAVMTALEMLAGGVLLYVFGAIRGEFGSLRFADVSTSSLVGLIWLIFAGSIVAFTAYVYANSTLPTDLVATYAYVNPIVAVVIGALLGQEALHLNVLVGGAIIIGSVALIVTSGRSRSSGSKGTDEASAQPRESAPSSAALKSAGAPGDA